MTYKWKVDGFYKGDANKVGEELSFIEKDGELTNENVLEFAKTYKDSELHKCFEWNDAVCGRKYRLIQANQIIQNIAIVISEEPQETARAFVNVKTIEEKRVFKNIISVIENDGEYNQLKEKAKQEFVSYKEKYEKIIKLKDLKNIIFEVL